jgi:hypothetical protein
MQYEQTNPNMNEQHFINYFNQFAKPIDRMDAPIAGAILFDFSYAVFF